MSGGSLIPLLWAEALADMGFTPEWFAAIEEASAKAPEHVRDGLAAFNLDGRAVVGFLRYVSERYVGDVELERAIPWMASLVEDALEGVT